MNNFGVEEDDPGGMAFYGEIAAMFDRMEQEEAPKPNENNKECQRILQAVLDKYGIMTVLVGIATALNDKVGDPLYREMFPNDCRHLAWLSSNLNVLVNKASEHNTEEHGFPFEDERDC